ncbi:MAG: hypothetical protein EPN93_21220 [Spirochaetes bacterium]|nr:MAG: hypothetical protein EPN93_21220 [Spirochaetota bacterium]
MAGESGWKEDAVCCIIIIDTAGHGWYYIPAKAMNIIVTAYLITAFICLESAVSIYRMNPQSRLNRIYTLLAASFTVYSAVMIQFLISSDESACMVWYRVFAFMACLFTMLGVRYFLELTGAVSITGNRSVIASLYLLPCVFALPAMSFAPVVSGFTRTTWGWEIIMKDSVWAKCFFSYLLGCYGVCVALAIRWRLVAEKDHIKKQATVIVLSGLAGAAGMLHLFFSSLHSGALNSDAGIHFYNLFCLLTFVLGIRFAIIRYRLMTLVPANPAVELFAGMHDAIFVTDATGEIVFTNDNAGCSGKPGPGSTIYDFFSPGETLKNQAEELIAGRPLLQPVSVAPYGQSRGNTAADVFLHGIKNEIGELIGFMFIARENRGLGDIQERFQLTNRELEIALLLNDGLSAREISAECDIALPTAKTHIHNIYRKTGLRNRVEISNLLNKNT